MRLVGERKALGAIVFALIAALFALNALMLPPQFKPMFLGLVIVYGASYFGLVAGWFWARWFASGVAMWGVFTAVLLSTQIGLDPIVFIWGGAHALSFLCLMGEGPRSVYEGRSDWRQRYGMDAVAATKLGKSVQRAGTALPYLIMAALSPKQEGMVLVLGLAAVGVFGLVRMRTWGILALGGAATLSFAEALTVHGTTTFGWGSSLLAAVLLAAAVVPFAMPLWRKLTAR